MTAGVDAEVAVGSVIARIVARAEVRAAVLPPGPAPAAVAPVPAPSPAPPAVAGFPAGRVLASPKARRLAAEAGIDLAGLRAQGIAEPIHAADLARLPAGQMSSLGARVNAAAMDALLARGGDGLDHARLYAGFAAAA